MHRPIDHASTPVAMRRVRPARRPRAIRHIAEIATVTCVVLAAQVPPSAGAVPAHGNMPSAGSAPSAESGPEHSAGRSTGYVWPLDPVPQVTRGFDPPQTRYGRGHRGIDLAGAPGKPVLSAGPGVVAYAGPVAGRGVVSIDHRSGLRTTYEPLTPAVSAGEQVSAGDVIGTLAAGHPGCPRAACLHWGLRDGRDGEVVYLDPRSLLGSVTVRLLPV